MCDAHHVGLHMQIDNIVQATRDAKLDPEDTHKLISSLQQEVIGMPFDHL
jgi:hypothetical protein